MNKTELVAAVAEKAEISKKDADSAVNAVIESIIEAVAESVKRKLVKTQEQAKKSKSQLL